MALDQKIEVAPKNVWTERAEPWRVLREVSAADSPSVGLDPGALAAATQSEIYDIPKAANIAIRLFAVAGAADTTFEVLILLEDPPYEEQGSNGEATVSQPSKLRVVLDGECTASGSVTADLHPITGEEVADTDYYEVSKLDVSAGFKSRFVKEDPDDDVEDYNKLLILAPNGARRMYIEFPAFGLESAEPTSVLVAVKAID